MVEIVDRTDGIRKMVIAVGQLQRIVPVYPAGGAEIWHQRHHGDISFKPRLPLQMLEHQLLVVDEVFRHIVHRQSRPDREIGRMVVPVETCTAAGYCAIRQSDISLFDRTPTAIERDRLCEIGVEIAAGYCGNPGAAQKIRITGCIDKHPARGVFQSRFGIGHHTPADTALHLRIYGGTVEKQIDSGTCDLLHELHCKNIGGNQSQ